MKNHYTAAISAFLIWGFFSIPLRALKAYSAGEILYFRILFSAVLLLIIVLGFKRKDIIKDWIFFKTSTSAKQKEVIGLTLLGGALLTVNWLTFIYIVNNINIKTASFSYLICPVITAVLGYVLIKERLTVLQWIAVAFCAVSCILMGINSALELGYSFLTAFTYALYLITQRRNQGFDRMVMLCIQVMFSFLLLNFIHRYLIQSVPATTEFYSIIVVIAVLFTVLPLFLNLFALNKINSATIGILMYINPIINFSVAIVVFKETISAIQIVGYFIIVLALILFNYHNFVKMKSVAFQKPV
ncbi:MAG TPA: EamA family transporter [Chryseolinea sp.]|nr:EamA family transporter [Chryseolinea sp.]HPH45689.1 EamA family transporter [Chryseolinea sp.]HPM28699.1 EamA family transporter [Chryseolinea sp.]